ncbi:hypothetical protein SAMN05216377_11521 [Pseudonocardia oroxyli]|uniref:Uncharacterized protein n=1 Tax=Pseudonocardia oroxyli TaxID=366584 RepID=A0A1G7WYA6_PSEOR|nr:hypothetical protein SAMN05216377_11521 [Pseudonocardia oroxyli]
MGRSRTTSTVIDVHLRAMRRIWQCGARVSRSTYTSLLGGGKMPFFSPPDDLDRPHRPAPGPKPAVWAQPPELVIPGILPERMRLAETEAGTITLVELRAFPQGCWWEIVATVRASDDWATARRAWNVLFGTDSRRTADGGLPPELLRFGLQYSDGSSASTLTRVPVVVDETLPPPTPPVLYVRPTSAGPSHDPDWLRISIGLWQWPLPPDGPFELVFEYPLISVAETRFEFSGTRIREAAEEAFSTTPRSSIV